MSKRINIYFISFLLISCMGWIYEVVLQVFFQRIGFHNRGVLFGPICPIYGFGGLLLYFALRSVKERKIKIWKVNVSPLLVLIGSFIITTLVELVGSYIMELFFGKWMWNYSKYFLNFQGRVAFSSSLRFAIGGTLIVYIVMPVMYKLSKKISDKILYGISGGFLAILICDIVYTFVLK